MSKGKTDRDCYALLSKKRFLATFTSRSSHCMQDLFSNITGSHIVFPQFKSEIQ